MCVSAVVWIQACTWCCWLTNSAFRHDFRSAHRVLKSETSGGPESEGGRDAVMRRHVAMAIDGACQYQFQRQVHSPILLMPCSCLPQEKPMDQRILQARIAACCVVSTAHIALGGGIGRSRTDIWASTFRLGSTATSRGISDFFALLRRSAAACSPQRPVLPARPMHSFSALFLMSLLDAVREITRRGTHELCSGKKLDEVPSSHARESPTFKTGLRKR